MAEHLVHKTSNDNIEVYNPKLQSWDYWIPQAELRTRRGLIRWIRHLCEKNWITREHIYELVNVMGFKNY